MLCMLCDQRIAPVGRIGSCTFGRDRLLLYMVTYGLIILMVWLNFENSQDGLWAVSGPGYSQACLVPVEAAFVSCRTSGDAWTKLSEQHTLTACLLRRRR